MAYTPTEWVSGTIISASKLNNIERGVESVNSEYTPTTWAEGDTVTAAKLNKIEQGIADASGGGGSSDFSTAQVTITFESEWCSLVAPFISVASETSDTEVGSGFHSGDTANVILYKGSARVYCNNGSITNTSGDIQDITVDPMFPEFRITGDCTIGITGDT